MGSSLFKDFDEQLGGAIGDHVCLNKIRPTVDEGQEFHNPSRVIQIADGGLKSGKQLDGDAACRLFSLRRTALPVCDRRALPRPPLLAQWLGG